ncbi:MAG TPA: AMP-binding protein, partial [Verrucomicrobiae bacterium]|nr:AMP-binding protein [Verrucomicrobiae bacterium]
MSQILESGLPWAKSYDPKVPLSQTYPEVTLCHLLNDVVDANRERTALIFFGKNITYGELANYISGMAISLNRLGIGRGDKVVLLLPNCPQFVISYYGVLLSGASVVPVNPLSTDTELSHIFQDSGVKLVIALDLLAGKVEGVRKNLHAKGSKIAEHAYYTSLKDFMPFPINLLYPLKQKISPEAKQALNGTKQYMTLLKGPAGPMQMPAVEVHKDIGVLIYTGGTTGRPKGVMLSHYALVVNAMQARSWVNMHQNDRQITVLPLFHGFGMSVCMNAILLAGGSTVLIPRFDPLEVLKSMDKFKPTLFAGVPTMFIALINHPELKSYDLSSLRACYVGAAALAPEIKRQFEELTGARLMEGYGLTEAVTAICANPFERTNKTGSIGIPFSDVIMGIRDVETGETELPANRTGEIVLKSPSVMLGYYNRPQETAEALKSGWLYTGDIGYMDEEGYFYIVDRKKDMIISGGFN